jgi:hypothetical protein
MTDVPFGRGGSPLQNLIVRGRRETKLTALRMSREFDAGPVYMKEPLSLEGGAEEIYLGSADLMWRNLSHRVEILFPVHNPALVSRLKDTLHIQLADERNSYHLRSDGTYARSKKREQPDAIDSQLHFLTQQRVTRQVPKSLGDISRKRRVAARRAHAEPKS